MFYGADPDIFCKAKELRKNMTEAELLIWEKLKHNSIGYRFKPQHPIGRFIADFYCHQLKLVIEIDGDIHELQEEYDLERTKEMNRLGIRVVRFTNEEVRTNLVDIIERIKTHTNVNFTPPLNAYPLKPFTPKSPTPKSPEGDF